jgi:hypothetical protein
MLKKPNSIKESALIPFNLISSYSIAFGPACLSGSLQKQMILNLCFYSSHLLSGAEAGGRFLKKPSV